MSPAARQRTALAGVLVLIFDAAIWLVPRGDSFEPPQPFPLRIAVPVLLAAPGLLAVMAAATGRRTVAIAAGVLCLPQAAISFSGITLVFLIPALAILWSAGGSSATERRPMRPRRLLVAILLAVPIVYATIATLGFLAPVLLVVVAGVAGLAGRRGPVDDGRPRTVGLREGATGAAIVILVVGAWVTILGVTETVCWKAREDPTGTIVWEQVPPSSELSLSEGEIGESCASGQPSAGSIGLAAVLLAAAVLRAALPVERRTRVAG